MIELLGAIIARRGAVGIPITSQINYASVFAGATEGVHMDIIWITSHAAVYQGRERSVFANPERVIINAHVTLMVVPVVTIATNTVIMAEE